MAPSISVITEGKVNTQVKIKYMVVADDHPMVLDALEGYLKRIGPDIVVERAQDFDRAVDCAGKFEKLDLVILDVKMPGMNGLEGLDVMKTRFPGVPVVLMSGYNDVRLIRKAMARGAAGFLPKDLSGQAMQKALELILSGEAYVPLTAFSEDPDDSSGIRSAHNNSFAPSSPLARLTRRELQILTLLCEGSTNKSIARDLAVKGETVAFHLRGVFRKLGVARRTEAAMIAMSLGLAYTPPETPYCPGPRQDDPMHPFEAA